MSRPTYETRLYYLHADQLGSTALTTNASGNAVDDHGYYAYGKDRRGSELRTPQRFTGQQGDATGLIYYGACSYDPPGASWARPVHPGAPERDTLVPVVEPRMHELLRLSVGRCDPRLGYSLLAQKQKCTQPRV